MLPGTVTDDSLPRYYPVDSILSKGSLLLHDFGKTDNTFGSFPAHLAPVKNLAWDIAKTMIPTGDQTTLGSVVHNSLTAGKSIAEVTPKKGLHVIITQTADVGTDSNDFRVDMSTLLKNYLLDNGSNSFYASYWSKRTRVATTTVSADFYLERNTSNSKFSFESAAEIPNPTQTSLYLGHRRFPTTMNTVSNYFRSLGFKGYLGTIDTDRNLIYFRYKIGSSSPYSSQETNTAPSEIIYRLYIEDLTVSGRTYAQVDALDKALYDAAFASGGRFYNDTHTDPATLP